MDVFQDYLCYSELSVLQTKKMRINIGQYWTDYQCGRLLRPIFSIFSDYWSMYFLIANKIKQISSWAVMEQPFSASGQHFPI